MVSFTSLGYYFIQQLSKMYLIIKKKKKSKMSLACPQLTCLNCVHVYCWGCALLEFTFLLLLLLLL